jgi:hypothetical protein
MAGRKTATEAQSVESISQMQNIQLVYNKRLVSNICFATENIHEAEKTTGSNFKKIL